MQEELIAIKGVNDGLLISLSTTEKWQSVTDQLAARIDEQADFYNGARITVELGARPVPKYELSSLKALLERRGLKLGLVISESDTTRNSAIALEVPTRENGRAESHTTAKQAGLQETAPVDSEETGTLGTLFRRTLRSGRTIHSEGHVVVFGDVNPGAKVIAAGDIVIWGKLRGYAHAGVKGDETAIVCALDMSPSQLRIAGHVATSPPGRRKGVLPEVAKVRDSQIIVEARE
ncbi:MAG: septum site-determining protein MinC [Chloroflexi bacterium]|nr:septum site-determining protein MinC [Chloroflexota bacterium]